MKSTFLKSIAIFSLLAAPVAFAQARPTNFFAVPQDGESGLIIANDPTRVCIGTTFVHPQTGVISPGTATAGSACLGKQQNQKPTCNADGQRDCVIADDGKFSAVDAGSANSNLKPGLIRRGQTLGGVQGLFPSTQWPLNPGTAPSALSTSGVTRTAPQNFLLFGTDGTPYRFRVGKISDGDFVPLQTPSFFLSAPTSSAPTTLYLPFRVSGDSDLSSENILMPTNVLGVQGTSLPRNLFKAESTGLVEVKDSLNAVIAKATVFIDYPTQNRWILMRDNTVNAPRLTKTNAEALALCTAAKVTVGTATYSSSTGTWALPTSNQVAWALKTGVTGPDGLITREGTFESKFWVSDTGTYKTAYFPDAITDPVIETAAVTEANVVCVFKSSTTGTGSSSNPPPNPVNLAATTPASGQIALTWTNGGGSTFAFKVSYLQGQTAPGNCSLGTPVPAASVNLTGATISGLSPSTMYSFRVCAIDNGTTPLVSAGITTTATTSGSSGSGAASGSGSGGTPFTLKTDTGPVLFGTKAPDGTTDITLAAHLYMSGGTRAFAYVFKHDATTYADTSVLYTPNASRVTQVCTNLGSTIYGMQTNPLGNFNYTWMPVSTTILDANTAGFRLAPFLGGVTGDTYGLGNPFLAFDNMASPGSFGLFSFSATGGNAVPTGSNEGSVICTAGQ